MFSCNPCSSSDPTSDTVKLDMSKVNAEAQAEQCRKADAEAAERRKAEEADAQRRAEEAESSRQLEADAKEREEQERKGQEQEAAEAAAALAAEERRREEEAERLRLQQEHEERERQAAEEAERRRKEAEQQQQQQQQQMEAEDKENRGRLDSWLKKEKFEGVNHKRKSMMKAKYPLHSAIKRQDLDVVQLLLRYNADPALKDSNNQTPQQLAEKSNKDGSLGGILQALS